MRNGQEFYKEGDVFSNFAKGLVNPSLKEGLKSWLGFVLRPVQGSRT
jgi:hypothetical protein